MAVELIYDADCPNAGAARRQLLKAFVAIHRTPQWREWNRTDPASPAYAQDYGSPTILVDGHDVVGETKTTDSNCCRLYAVDGGYQGIPALSVIVSALERVSGNVDRVSGESRSTKAGLAGIVSLLPSLGMAALPKVFCPVCWPAYSALLGSMGLGFVDYTPYMLPLTLLFLMVVVAMLGYRAKQRHGYRPLILGTIAAAVILFGKFRFESDAALYAGIGLLVIASIWNAWPRRSGNAHCSNCEIPK